VERPPIDLLRPFDSDKMKAWPVSTRINSVRNNDASLIEPIESAAEDEPVSGSGQMEMFG